MPINYDELMQATSKDVPASYGDRETMLYALGVGFQRDPMDINELPFTYENGLKTVPTMATVIGWGATNTLAKANINYMMVVHGEQRLTLHKPLPDTAEVLMDERVAGVFDKGAGKGAIVITERTIREKASGAKLCTLQSTIFARGDGGFGGKAQGGPALHEIPGRVPDHVVEVDTRPDQAFLYALSGDRNPLHRDPAFARAVGFPRPILHGLCSYGTACRAVLTALAGYRPERIKQFDVRFSKPVFPGETLVVEMWADGGTISWRAGIKERPGTIALNNGLCRLDG